MRIIAFGFTAQYIFKSQLIWDWRQEQNINKHGIKKQIVLKIIKNTQRPGAKYS